MKTSLKRFIQHVPVEGIAMQQLEPVVQALTDAILKDFDAWQKGKKIINIFGPTTELNPLHDIDMRPRLIMRMQVLHEEKK